MSYQPHETLDLIEALVVQEDRFYRCRDYLEADRAQHLVDECAMLVSDSVSKSPSAVSVSDVRSLDQGRGARPAEDSFAFWRQQMFDWACMVVDSFQIDREIVAVAFALLDRYVSIESMKGPRISRDDFQLFSMTCLYMAVKILEPYPRKIGLDSLVDMSRGFYSEDDIAVTEQEILKTLQWHLHPPTAIAHCRLLWSLLAEEAPFTLQITCTTLTEIAITDASFVSHQSYWIGLASFILACRLEGNIPEDQLRRIVQSLSLDTSSPEFRSVYTQLEKLYCQ